MNESQGITTEPVRTLKSLPRALDEQQIVATLHQFRLRSDGHSEIRMGPPGSGSVIISSTDAAHLESDWQLLHTIIDQLAARASRSRSRESQRSGQRPGQRAPERAFSGRSTGVSRPVQLLDSPLFRRLPAGGLCLVGDAARLLAALDRRFLALARAEGAEPIECPPIWHRDQLHSFGYDNDSANLLTVERPGEGAPRYWQLAVCNNVWLHLAGQRLAGPARFTARGTCCRSEGGHYFMLERMRSFSMREVMFVGSPGEVRAFRERALGFLAAETEALGLHGRLSAANDPFFLLEQPDDTENGPEDNSDALASDGDTSKMELRLDLYDDKSMACASVNVHGSFFAARMDIAGPDPDEKLWTACVAFGLERWVWAMTVQYGPRAERWPDALQRAMAEL